MVESYPAADGKQEVLAWEEQGGGPAATALVALARLGVLCRFYGVVGGDAAGEKIRASLAGEGINVSGLVTRRNATSQTAFIAVEKGSGRRTIFWRRPSGEALCPAEVGEAWLEGCRFLLLDGLMAEASLEAARCAKAHGIPVMLDAGRLRPGMLETAWECAYLVASEYFARELGWDGVPEHFTGQAERLGAPVVTVTLGERGSVTWADGDIISVPAFAVPVADTTGAGDVFHGGYIYGLLQGWSLRETIVFASAMAALKCTRLGGQAGIPALPEVVSFLAEHGGER
jgi:ribokinase